MSLKLCTPVFFFKVLTSILLINIFNTYSNENKIAYNVLHSIRSPQELLHPVLPFKFCVPVSLSGTIAEEMGGALKNLNLETPSYVESFDGSNFKLSLANESYPEQTSDLLSGVLNPLEIIDLIIQSLVNYKSAQKFSELISETNLEIQKSQTNSTTIKISLTPKGTRFAYNYDDNGAFIQESYLTGMNVTIDTTTHLVYEINICKLHRQFSTDLTKEPIFDTLFIKYVFSYDVFNKSSILPCKLQIFSNDEQTLEIGVTYRKEGTAIVFDTKEIVSIHGSRRSDLVVKYGKYSMAICKIKKSSSEQINKRLIAASTLSKKAIDYLHKGNISASARVLRELVVKYDDTPQAIEARRLLSQLPSDLR